MKRKTKHFVWADFCVCFPRISLCSLVTANEAADDQSVSGPQICWESRTPDLEMFRQQVH